MAEYSCDELDYVDKIIELEKQRDELEWGIKEFLDYVAEKHKIKSFQEFRCTHIFHLACLIGWKRE